MGIERLPMALPGPPAPTCTCRTSMKIATSAYASQSAPFVAST